MRYILILLILLNNVACTKVNTIPKKILQKDGIFVPVPSPSTEKQNSPQKNGQQNTSMTTKIPENSTVSIQTIGIDRVAAYLTEIGYFDGPLQEATLNTVIVALKSFQQDIQIMPTGILDETTWHKLQRLTLSHPLKSELEAIIAKKMATEKMREPFSSDFKWGESVYAIEKIECKSDHEAFMLIYHGKFQQAQKNKIQVRVNKRYAMWYDSQKNGISEQDWWCIPKKRFCYSPINFTDWGGQLKSNEVGNFDANLTGLSDKDMMSFIAQFVKKNCSI